MVFFAISSLAAKLHYARLICMPYSSHKLAPPYMDLFLPHHLSPLGHLLSSPLRFRRASITSALVSPGGLDICLHTENRQVRSRLFLSGVRKTEKAAAGELVEGRGRWIVRRAKRTKGEHRSSREMRLQSGPRELSPINGHACLKLCPASPSRG